MIGFRNKKSSRKRQPAADYDKNRAYTYRSQSREENKYDNERSRGNRTKSGLAGFFRIVLFVLGLLAFVAVAAYATALGTNAKIKFDGGRQNAPRISGQYSDKAHQILGESLNNRWKFSIKKPDIADSLQQSFPEISSVDISTPPWSYQPIINITVSQPRILLVSAGDKYLVDSSGVAMITLKDVQKRYKPGNLPEVIDETGYLVEEGKPILSSEQVDFIDEIIFQTNQKRLTTSQINLKPGGEEVHFKFEGLSYLVKFSFEVDSRKSAGAFLSLKKHLEAKGPLPNEYIDARVPERAYVR
jgi:hypothetical protein